MRNGKLVIQSPVKTVREYTPDLKTGNATTTRLDDSLVNQAIAWYQCTSWLLKHKRQQQ
jgi:hypothetical protein